MKAKLKKSTWVWWSLSWIFDSLYVYIFDMSAVLLYFLLIHHFFPHPGTHRANSNFFAFIFSSDSWIFRCRISCRTTMKSAAPTNVLLITAIWRWSVLSTRYGVPVGNRIQPPMWQASFLPLSHWRIILSNVKKK